MKLKTFVHIFVFSLVGGILLFLSHPPVKLFGLAFVCLFPLFFLVRKLRSYKYIFLSGFLTGLVYFLLLLNWVLKIKIEHIDSPIFGVLMLKWFVFLSLVLIGTLSVALFAILIKFGFGFNSRWKSMLFISSSLVVVEYFRSYLASLFFLGKESLLGPHWTFGALGYNLVDYFFIMFASFGGIYLLTFVVVVLNLVIFWSFCKKISLKFLLLIFLLVFVPLTLIDSNGGESVKIGVVQTNGRERDYVEDLNDLIRETLSEADIVVLPENIGSKSHFELSGENNRVDVTPSDNQLLVYSKYSFLSGGESSRATNNVLYLDGTNNRIHIYSKTFLMPFGEYPPYFLDWIYPSSLGDKYIEKGDEMKTVLFEGNKVGAIVCGSFMSPVLSHALVSGGGSEVVINLASNSVFGEDDFYRRLSLEYSRIRAVETNRYFVQAAHEGFSFVIDNFGRKIFVLEDRNSSSFVSEIKLISDKNVFLLFGDKIILFFIFFILFLIAFCGRE